MTPEERATLQEYLRRKADTNENYCPHEPTEKQQAFLEYEGLEALYGGAAGGGKSDALLMGALQYAHVPGYAALLLRKSFPDLALPGAIMDRASAWLTGTKAHWDGINKRWSFPIKRGEQQDGIATMSFGYLKDENDHLRYQGAEFQYVAFDEVTQFREKHYSYLFSRLRRLTGVDVPIRMRGATNPGGPGHVWVKGRFGIPDDVDMSKPHKHRHPTLGDLVFFPAKLDDNPHVDRDEYELALSKLDRITQAQLRHGSWRQDTSALVYAFDRNVHLVGALPKLPGRAAWVYVLGIDYGHGDATALAVWAFCIALNDVSYLVESKKWGKLIPSAAAKIVEAWGKRYPFSRMVGDMGGLGKGYAEEGRVRFALPIEPAQKQNKRGYIRLMNGAFEDRKILVVEPMNAEYIEEAEGLPWKDETKEEEAPGVPNDALDAGLYGWRESRAFRAIREEQGPAKGSPEWHAQQDREAEEQEAREAQEEAELDEM